MPGIDHGARVQAPVDEQLGAGAAARVVGHEECDRRADLAGLRRPLPRQPDVAARSGNWVDAGRASFASHHTTDGRLCELVDENGEVTLDGLASVWASHG